MTVVLADTFTRADNASVPGTPDTGGPWTVALGTWGVNGNRLYTSVSTVASRILAPASYNFDATFQFPVLGGNSQGFIFRATDSNNYWMIYHPGGAGVNFILYRVNAGTGNNIATLKLLSNAASTYRVVGKGRLFYFYQDGTWLDVFEDQYSGTASQAGFYQTSSTTARFDNLSIDDSPPADPTGHEGDTAGTIDEEADLATADLGDAYLYKGRDTRGEDEGNEA